MKYNSQQQLECQRGEGEGEGRVCENGGCMGGCVCRVGRVTVLPDLLWWHRWPSFFA